MAQQLPSEEQLGLETRGQRSQLSNMRPFRIEVHPHSRLTQLWGYRIMFAPLLTVIWPSSGILPNTSSQQSTSCAAATVSLCISSSCWSLQTRTACKGEAPGFLIRTELRSDQSMTASYMGPTRCHSPVPLPCQLNVEKSVRGSQLSGQGAFRSLCSQSPSCATEIIVPCRADARTELRHDNHSQLIMQSMTAFDTAGGGCAL